MIAEEEVVVASAAFDRGCFCSFVCCSKKVILRHVTKTHRVRVVSFFIYILPSKNDHHPELNERA